MSNSFSVIRLSHTRIPYALGVVITLLCVCLCMGLGAKSAYADADWHTWGDPTTGVEWNVDNNKLTIRPHDDGAEGTMPNVNNEFGANSLPWNDQRESITEVEFQGSIKSSESLYGLFLGMTSLRSIDFGNFDTSRAEDMFNMFRDCYNLTSLDLSSFDTSNVTNMGNMFENCASLISLDLSSFNTSKVRDMAYMFESCTSLPSLDLSSFDTSNVWDVAQMFSGCPSLQKIYVSDNWSMSSVGRSMLMVYGADALCGGSGTKMGDIPDSEDPIYARIDGGPEAPGYLTRGYEASSLPTLSQDLTYGETPSFEGGSVTFGQGTTQSPQVTVEGTWSLDPRVPKPQAGDTSLSIVFTPDTPGDNKKYYTTITIKSVAKRPVIVTPKTGQSKAYNAVDPTFTYRVDNLLQEDIPSDIFTGSLSRESGFLPGGYNIQVGTLTLKDGGKAENYSFDRDNGFYKSILFTIEPLGRILESPVTSFAYTGGEYSIVSLQDGQDITQALDIEGTIKATEVGSYSATLTPKPGYVWGETGYSHDKKTISWSIDSPVFPDGGGDTKGPINPDDPNGSNPPAAPTDPAVPTKGDPGWSYINGNWYYYNLSGILISGWISDSYHWYYLDDKGIMQVGWLLDPQDNNWHYLNNTQGDTYGALQTGWLLDVDGTWYYLNPISDGTLGSVQSGWLYIDGSWYYANPAHDTTFGALQEGWLSYNDAWYYLYPIHDGSFGYMYTGFNLIDMRPYVFTETGELIS